MFSLKLLGGATIQGPQGPLGGRVLQRRRLALSAVLAVARDRPVSRDKLLAFFWPESDPERARHSLADSVYQLRKAMGEGALLGSGEELWLNPEVVQSDVSAFEAALVADDLVKAVQIYAGPFLDGFFLSEAPEFERWVERERERLAGAYAGALEALAEAAEEQRDFGKAVGWWKARAAHDPYDSHVALRLMQALDASGNRAGALQHAAIHQRLLQEDLGIEPSPEVRALTERLRCDTAPAPTLAVEERRTEPGVHTPAEAPAREEDRAPSEPVRSLASAELPRSTGRQRTRRAAALAALVPIGFAFVLAVGRLFPSADPSQAAPTQPRDASPQAIAVLPFVNVSHDPEEEYFSDGLTEELISALSEIASLRVVARTSSFAFKGENRDIREIGQKLNAGTVLEGSIRRDGDRVRVTAQLINAADGFHLWSETYEREVTDITGLFEIWSELALQITTALEAELTPAERARLARRPTADPQAYALYLKGRHFWNQRTRSGFARAIEYYERAIHVDPQYAAAYAGLAMCHSLQGLSGDLPPQTARERMRRAALKAVALDEQSAEAHAAVGAYLNLYEWDSEASEGAYLRSIELDPSYGTARHLYSNLLRATGRLDEAIAQKRKAVELDPLAPMLSNSLGITLLEDGRPAEALEQFQSVLELDSTFWAVHASLGDFYARAGRFDEAIRAYQLALEREGERSNPRAGLARVLALAGREDEARRMLAELQADTARSGIFPPQVATVFLALGEVEGALAWLERSYEQRHPGLRFIGGIAGFAPLEGDPRFADLRRRIGLRR